MNEELTLNVWYKLARLHLYLIHFSLEAVEILVNAFFFLFRVHKKNLSVTASESQKHGDQRQCCVSMQHKVRLGFETLNPA